MIIELLPGDELFEGDDEMLEIRINELSNGAPLTESEERLWREDVVKRAFSEELRSEQGAGIVWAVVELKHSKRGLCCLGVLDWKGQRERFVAAYSTRMEVLNSLKGEGFLGKQDYLARAQESR